jgi:hypothetical protein
LDAPSLVDARRSTTEESYGPTPRTVNVHSVGHPGGEIRALVD